MQDRLRNKARARGVHVAVAVRALRMRIEAVRYDQVQMILGARHRDIEQTAFLLDFRLRAGGKIGRNAAVDAVEHEHRIPFLTLGRVDGRQNQIILVTERRAGLVARCARRIERKLGEKALAARIAQRDLGKLQQVGLPCREILVNSLQVRLVPAAHQIELGRPAGDLSVYQPQRIDEGRPVGSRRGWRGEVRERVCRVAKARSAIERPRRVGRAETGQKLQHAKTGDAVAHVFRPAQKGEHVPDVGRFEEFQTAVFDERNVAPGQFHFQRSGMVRGAKQHRLRFERQAALAMMQDGVDHEAGLAGFIVHADKLRPLVAGALRFQILGEPFRRELDHGVGGRKNRLRRAVIVFECDHLRARSEMAGKVENVAYGCGAERIDRLRIVADDREASAVRLERQENRGLQTIGVLVFVDQDVIEAIRNLGRDHRLGHHVRPVQQQIVEIEHVLALLGLDIGRKQRAQRPCKTRAPRKMRFQHFVQRALGVDDARIDRKAGVLGRKALLGLGIAEIVPDQIKQVRGILAVMDRERAIETDAFGMFAKQTRADAVERARPGDRSGHSGAAFAQRQCGDALDAAAHLGCGAAREGQQQQAVRIGAVDEQMRHPVRERVGLAGPRAGNDQKRTGLGNSRPAMFDGAALLRIELVEIRRCHGYNHGHRPARRTLRNTDLLLFLLFATQRDHKNRRRTPCQARDARCRVAAIVASARLCELASALSLASETGRADRMLRTFEQLIVATAPGLFVVLWASGFIGAKLGLAYVEPLTFLTLRMIAVVMLLGVIIAVTRPKWPSGPAALHSALTGLLVHGCYLGGVFVAIENGLSAGLVALIVSLQPVLTSTIANRWLGERVARRQWLGLALGLLGVYLIVRENIAAAGTGALAWLAAALALGGITVGTLYQKRFGGGIDWRTGLLLQYAAAGLLFLLGALMFEHGSVDLTPQFVFALCWLVFVLSFGAIWLFYFLIRRSAATRVVSLFYLTPPLTALMAWLFFDETLAPPALIGMAVCVVGVFLVNWRAGGAAA